MMKTTTMNLLFNTFCVTTEVHFCAPSDVICLPVTSLLNSSIRISISSSPFSLSYCHPPEKCLLLLPIMAADLRGQSLGACSPSPGAISMRRPGKLLLPMPPKGSSSAASKICVTSTIGGCLCCCCCCLVLIFIDSSQFQASAARKFELDSAAISCCCCADGLCDRFALIPRHPVANGFFLQGCSICCR